MGKRGSIVGEKNICLKHVGYKAQDEKCVESLQIHTMGITFNTKSSVIDFPLPKE